MTERYARMQIISKSGEPGIRYELVERFDPKQNKVVLAATPKEPLEGKPYQMGWEHYLADAVWSMDED